VTDNTEEELDFLGRAQIAARWCRDEAGAFISTFWLIIALYALGGWLVYSFLQLDAQFSRPLAGDAMPPEVTQHISWANRIFSIIVGMAIIWCHMHGMKKFRNVMSTLGFVAALLLLLHAYGIAAKVMKTQYSAAAAIELVNQEENASSDAVIAALEKQKEGIRADRDGQVERLQASIDKITGDGVDNDDEADPYRIDQTAAETAAQTKLDKIDAQIVEILTDTGTKNVGATQDTAMVDAFNPLFTLMARVATWTWNPDKDPSTTAEYVSGIVFFTMFFGLGELLMMTLFTVAYAMLLVARENSRKNGKAQVIRLHKGQTAMVFDSDEERDEFERAKEVHDNIKAGAKKGARTKRVGNKIEQGREYAADRISEMMTLKQQGHSTVEIAEKYGLTLASLKASYMQYMTQEEIDFLFPTAVVPVQPGPKMANGRDTPEGDDTDEQDIDPEQPPAH